MLVVLLFSMQEAEAKEKTVTKKTTIDMRVAKKKSQYLYALKKCKKVTVRSSKKSVVVAKYPKKKRNKIVLYAKKTGSVVVNVTGTMKNGKKKRYKIKVKVIKSRKLTDLDKGKKAFAIQNQYRKAKGIKELEWSDEIYEFCRYRLKTSGYDKHDNLANDMNAYFGGFAGYKNLLFSENMTTGATAKDAMESWKKSQKHYNNLLSERHVCGAIACYKDMWIAIFYDKDKSDFANWKSFQMKKITVKRYDSASNRYIAGSGFAYYEESKKNDTLKVDKIPSSEGKVVYLEIGKSYVFYERIVPDGYEKAKTVRITVEDNGINEIVLSN